MLSIYQHFNVSDILGSMEYTSWETWQLLENIRCMLYWDEPVMGMMTFFVLAEYAKYLDQYLSL